MRQIWKAIWLALDGLRGIIVVKVMGESGLLSSLSVFTLPSSPVTVVESNGLEPMGHQSSERLKGGRSFVGSDPPVVQRSCTTAADANYLRG